MYFKMIKIIFIHVKKYECTLYLNCILMSHSDIGYITEYQQSMAATYTINSRCKSGNKNYFDKISKDICSCKKKLA